MAEPPSWTELLGSRRWSGLLDPLDISLRRLILLSGDLCQVTYDAFNDDPHSKYCGSSRYGPGRLLHRTAFPFDSDYGVADFLYATAAIDLPPALLLFSRAGDAWSRESNWMGFVAASTDAAAAASGRREIFVAWRGTIRNLEWADVLRPELVPLDPVLDSDNSSNGDAMVMKGWHTIYTSSNPASPFTGLSARDQLLASIKKLVDRYKHEKGGLSIVCVGHSLGASLAVLSAFDIVENGYSNGGEIPVCAVVFGSPQVGNKAFNDRVEGLPNLRVLRVKNKIDVIPLYPTGLLGFVNTGVELTVDGRKSPYLKPSKNPSDWHNLQGILHAVAGWNGDNGEFELKVERSLALVNKSSEYLKDEYLIPGSWWVEKNKGMVLGPDGNWGLAPPDEDDIPVPPSSVSSTTAAADVSVDQNVNNESKQGKQVSNENKKSHFSLKMLGSLLQ